VIPGAYGLFLALGVAAGAAVIYRLAPRLSLDPRTAMDMVFWSVLAGMVGARVLYVLVEWSYFRDLCFSPELREVPGIPCTSAADCMPGQQCDGQWCRMQGDCLAALKVWEGGYVFLGGLAAGVATAALFMRRARIPLAAGFGLLSTALPLGHAFGRVGCFFHGCCYGRTSDHLPAIDGRFPIQLVEAAGNLLIFGLVLRALLRATRSPSPAAAGELSGALVRPIGTYFLLYGLLRLVTELGRGDPQRGYLFEVPWPAFSRALGFPEWEPVLLSTSQSISVVLVAAGALLLVRRAGPSRAGGATPGSRGPS